MRKKLHNFSSCVYSIYQKVLKCVCVACAEKINENKKKVQR